LNGGDDGKVPDGTAQFQHLEWDGAAWIAQQTLGFGANSATSAKLNMPTDTIGIAWRNGANNGNLEIKGTLAGNLDITRDDNVGISLSLRSQNAIELDQSLSITVGSGSITSADIVIDASTSKLLIAVGGSTRLTIDALTSTAMILKSPIGITAQSSFSVISTHVTESDQAIEMFVGSGDSATAVLSTTAGVFEIALTNTSRWKIDVNVGNEITQTAFGINPLYDLFNDDDNPNDFDLLARINFSGRNSVGSKITYASILADILDVSNNTEDGSLVFNIMRAGVNISSLALNPFLVKILDSSVELDEVVLPVNPPSNKGKIYLRDIGSITTPFFLDSAGTETSMIAVGGGNEISQGDSKVQVVDVGFGFINFEVDGINQASVSDSNGWVFKNQVSMEGNPLRLDDDGNTYFDASIDNLINTVVAGSVRTSLSTNLFLVDTEVTSFLGDVKLGTDNLNEITINGLIITDINFGGGSTVNFVNITQNAINGIADDIPLKPMTYAKVRFGGIDGVIPIFAEF